jgi:hypothetical protein
MKIQKLEEQDLFDFWRQDANQNLFNAQVVERQELARDGE